MCIFSAALRGWDIAGIVQASASAGLSAIEWGAGPGQALVSISEGGSEVAELSRTHNLAAAGMSLQNDAATLADPAGILPYAELAERIGAPWVRIFAPAYAGGDIAHEIDHVRARLRAAVEIVAERDVKLLIEVCPGTLAPSTSLARRLIEPLSPEHVGVLFDPGNTVIEGFLETRLAIAALGPYLHHVHVKNVRWDAEAGGWKWRHAPLTEGFLQWHSIVAALSESGYDGWMCLDHLSATPTVGALRKEIAELRALIAQVAI